MNRSSKTVLFLIEMIIAIAFFAYSSAVCTSLFVKAHDISARTREETKAMTLAKSAGEVFKSQNGEASGISTVLGGKHDEKTVRVYYNKDWDKSDSKNAKYCLEIKTGSEGSFKTADISVIRAEDELIIYNLNLKKYCALN